MNKTLSDYFQNNPLQVSTPTTKDGVSVTIVLVEHEYKRMQYMAKNSRKTVEDLILHAVRTKYL